MYKLMKLASAPALLAKMSREGIEPPRPATTIVYGHLIYSQACGTRLVARVRFERTASDSLEVRGLPIAYRASVAQVRFERTIGKV
jgi:hypothetical protein